MSWSDYGISGAVTNTVTDFLIQPQRTKHITKRNTLDQLSETWIGPSALEDVFVPAVGTQHPIYPLMTVLTTEVRRSVQNCAMVSQVTINYHGKMINVPSGKYVSVPTYDTYWSEGEVSWEQNATITLPTPKAIQEGYYVGPQGGPGYIPGGAGQGLTATIYSISGIQQWSRRYIGKGVRLGYITNARPSGMPTQSVPKGDLGFALIYDVRGPFQQGANSTLNQESIITQYLCTDVSVSDSADGWYQVTETYQSRMFIEY